MPIFANILLGLLWRMTTINFHLNVSTDFSCNVSNIVESINFPCSVEGMFPLGTILFSFNWLVIFCVFIGMHIQDHYYNSLRTLEHQNAIRQFPDA